MEQVIHIEKISMAFLNNEEIGKRLLALRGETSSRKIAMDAKVDPSQYGKIEKGTLPITPTILEKLARTYNWDEQYILYGIGTNVPHGTKSVKDNYTKGLRDQKLTTDYFLVPLVDIPAMAGYKKSYDNIDFIEKLVKYPILPNVDPRGAMWMYFQIDGDSMEPEFTKGDIILVSQVPKEDWSQFSNLYSYVIVTNSGIFFKDVDRIGVEGYWILLSQNETSKPYPISISDVRQLWVMRRHIKNRAKKNRMYDLEKIRDDIRKQINNKMKK